MNSHPSEEHIQEKVLANFQRAAKTFYEDLQDDFLKGIRTKLEDGTIEVEENEIAELSLKYAKEYESMLKKSKKEEKFIKDYVNDTFDIVCDSLSEGIIEKEEAEIVFVTLKYILTAGKIELDKNTKLK